MRTFHIRKCYYALAASCYFRQNTLNSFNLSSRDSKFLNFGSSCPPSSVWSLQLSTDVWRFLDQGLPVRLTVYFYQAEPSTGSISWVNTMCSTLKRWVQGRQVLCTLPILCQKGRGRAAYLEVHSNYWVLSKCPTDSWDTYFLVSSKLWVCFRSVFLPSANCINSFESYAGPD